MAARSLISSTVRFDRPGVSRGFLHVPHSTNTSAYGHIPIPIAVANAGEGPTVLLTGGVHGDEYEGPVVLYELMRRLEGLPLSGRLIIVPSVNHPALLAGTRVSPIDAINLNRTFPGRRDGSITEMIAHFMSTELLPLSDYVIDCHAGGASLSYLPTLFAPEWEDPEKLALTAELVRAFAPARVAYYNSRGAPGGEDRVLGNAADRSGCRFLSGEFGGGASISLDGRSMLETGIDGVLRHVGLLPEFEAARPSANSSRHFVMSDPDLFAYAPAEGIFEPRYRLGDLLEPGSLAGVIHNPSQPWDPPVPVHFRSGGLALCIRTFAKVMPGDCLGHLAREIDPLA